MKRVVRYFQSPAFTAAEWEARNPYLNQGEIGYLLASGLSTRAKVGPGYWNSLPWLAEDVYPYTDEITNEIGDVVDPVNGLSLLDIVRKMISPYAVPAVSSLVNNLGGTYNGINTREIGESFAGPIQIIFNVSSPANLLGANPINVDGNGVFTSGSYPFSTPISLSVLAPPLAPVTPSTFDIEVTLTHINGVSSPAITQVKFLPRIMWASSALSTISDGNIFVGKPHTISDNFKNDYNFTGNGYSWLAIPSMLSPAGLVFSDLTNPDVPLGYSMESMGTLVAVNNGVGTYNYEIYRSTFSLLNSTILRVR